MRQWGEGEGRLLMVVSSPEKIVPFGILSVTGATFSECRCVVFCRNLLKYSEVGVMQDIVFSEVASFHSFGVKANGVMTPTPSVTFTSPVLPVDCTVDCSRWDHTYQAHEDAVNAKVCVRVAHSCSLLRNDLPTVLVCVSCGRIVHGRDCAGCVPCYHCGDAHPSPSAECGRYNFCGEILVVLTKDRVSCGREEMSDGLLPRPY